MDGRARARRRGRGPAGRGPVGDPVFAKLAGTSFDALKASAPGTANYVTALEYGYALHELTFAPLFLAIVLLPFRRGERWAWFACWIVLIAAIGYTATISHLDSTLPRRSLIADIAVPVFLLLSARSFFVTPAGRSSPAA